MFKKWKDAGFMFMSDIVVNNRFVNLIELRQLFRCPNYVFDFQKILTAIPRHWKTLISNNHIDFKIPKNNNYLFFKK